MEDLSKLTSKDLGYYWQKREKKNTAMALDKTRRL